MSNPHLFPKRAPSVVPLRQQMIEDMKVRNFSPMAVLSSGHAIGYMGLTSPIGLQEDLG
jgi:hypothetical protein